MLAPWVWCLPRSGGLRLRRGFLLVVPAARAGVCPRQPATYMSLACRRVVCRPCFACLPQDGSNGPESPPCAFGIAGRTKRFRSAQLYPRRPDRTLSAPWGRTRASGFVHAFAPQRARQAILFRPKFILVSPAVGRTSPRNTGHYLALCSAGPLVFFAGARLVLCFQVWASSLGFARPPSLRRGESFARSLIQPPALANGKVPRVSRLVSFLLYGSSPFTLASVG